MAGQSAFVLSGAPRVNLIPAVEIERRERASLLRKWGWGLVGALLFLGLIVAGAVFFNWAAQQTLAAEQTRTDELLTELSDLSEVRVALATQQDLETFRAQAMSTDIDWTALHATFTRALPAGVLLTGWDVGVGAAPVADADPATAVGLEGGLTFRSPNPVEMAPLIREVRALPGVIAADGDEVAKEEGDGPPVYTYELILELDQSLYTGAYAQEGQD